ncbi:Ni/Fe-hydrogenase cytochrome b subunit [Thermodesulfovibrionales bacterium]|nr:Ni/Fe-hydrogenase cytochrome b subunit [Thermodesulfovibrionales bacterium]
MAASEPLGGKIITKPFIVFSVIMLISLIFLFERYIFGLGAMTNMNDGFAWGIWKPWLIYIGTALGCGGYAMAIMVYIFGKGAKAHYYPLLRFAILTSLFGYTLGGTSLIVDLGRYWLVYEFLLPWNWNLTSVLLEVGLCMGLYIGILWLEFAPAVFEKLKEKKILRAFKKVFFVVVAFGLLLPTMHQSSLALMMVIAGHKVSPLWQTNLLPLLSVVSAVMMGTGAVIAGWIVTAHIYKRPYETNILSRVSVVMMGLIGAYLVLRFGDLIWRGQIGLIFAGDMNSFAFIIENILHIIPLLILASPANRISPQKLFIAGACLLSGGVLWRHNFLVTGFCPDPQWVFFPALGEVVIVLGFAALAMAAIPVLLKVLPVAPKSDH